jgi:hypothetical protein
MSERPERAVHPRKIPVGYRANDSGRNIVV